MITPEISDHFRTVLAWADEVRRLGVRANADTPEDAQRSRRVRRGGHRPLPHRAHVHGGRAPAQDARDDHGGDARPSGARRSRSCCPLQRADFEGLFEAMDGPARHDPAPRPAPARVPAQQGGADPRPRARRPPAASGPPRGSHELERLLERVRELEETNPMLGTRGCRLGILHPGDLRDAGAGDHRRGRRSAPAHGQRAGASRS